MNRRPTVTGDKRWIGIVILVCLALGQGVTMVVTAFATRDVITALRDGTEVIPTDALIAIAVAGLAIFAFRSAEGAVGEHTGQNYAAAIRRRLFLHMTKMPLSAMAERRAGATALRFVGDLTAFKGWVARGLARLISACVTIPAAFVILYLLEPRLAFVAAAPIGLVMLAIYCLGNPLGAAHADLRKKRARLAAAMAERLPQGIALRRSGRVKTELRSLDTKSNEIIQAAVRRARLAETVRAMPDAAAGIAGALCLWVCLSSGLGVEDAVAALTALALIVWPLRHLADVRDRQQAFRVARAKLHRVFEQPILPSRAKVAARPNAPAVCLENLLLPGLDPINARLERGDIQNVSGPAGSGKSWLLLMLAGLEPPTKGRIQVLGRDPSALATGFSLYLGPHAPVLKGSLRRNLTLGTGRIPDDDELMAVTQKSGLSDLVTRLGGLNGQVTEGARNLTSSEKTGVFLARGLTSRASLMLVDADEIGLAGQNLNRLLEHCASIGAATLVVTSALPRVNPKPLQLCLSQPSSLAPDSPAAETKPRSRTVV